MSTPQFILLKTSTDDMMHALETGGEGFKTPHAFPISVMLKSVYRGKGMGQIWLKKAYIPNGRPFKKTFRKPRIIVLKIVQQRETNSFKESDY